MNRLYNTLAATIASILTACTSPQEIAQSYLDTKFNADLQRASISGYAQNRTGVDKSYMRVDFVNGMGQRHLQVCTSGSGWNEENQRTLEYDVLKTLGLVQGYYSPPPAMGFGGFGWSCGQFSTPTITDKDHWSKTDIIHTLERLHPLAYRGFYTPQYEFKSDEEFEYHLKKE